MRKWLGAGSRDLRFGDKAILKEKIGATEVYSLVKAQGSVNPFALVNDKGNEIRLVVDKRVFEAKTVTFHPMQNDALIEISTDDFKKYLKAIGKTETVVDFEQLKKEVEAEPKKEGKKEPSKKEGKGKKVMEEE